MLRFHIETKLVTNVLDACGVGAESRTAQLHESICSYVLTYCKIDATSGSQTKIFIWCVPIRTINEPRLGSGARKMPLTAELQARLTKRGIMKKEGMFSVGQLMVSVKSLGV